MTDQAPIHQVLTGVDGYTGRVLKGRGREKVVFAYTAYRGVGIEAGNDGVSIGHVCGRLISLMTRIVLQLRGLYFFVTRSVRHEQTKGVTLEILERIPSFTSIRKGVRRRERWGNNAAPVHTRR